MSHILLHLTESKLQPLFAYGDAAFVRHFRADVFGVMHQTNYGRSIRSKDPKLTEHSSQCQHKNGDLAEIIALNYGLSP
jgi:hypothetical protein